MRPDPLARLTSPLGDFSPCARASGMQRRQFPGHLEAQAHPQGPSGNCRRSCVKAASCALPAQHPAPSIFHGRTVRPGAEAAFPRSPGGWQRWSQHSESRSLAPPLCRAEFGPGHSLSSNALGQPGVDTIRESGVAPACPSPVLEFCRMLTLQPWELWRPRRGRPQSCHFPRDRQA